MSCKPGATSSALEPDFRDGTSSPESFNWRFSFNQTAHDSSKQLEVALASPSPALSQQEQPTWDMVRDMQAEIDRLALVAALAKERQRQASLDTQASQRCVQRLLHANAELQDDLQVERMHSSQLNAALVAVCQERDALVLKRKLASDQATHIYASLSQSFVEVAEKGQQNAALAQDLAAATAEGVGLRAQLGGATDTITSLERQLAEAKGEVQSEHSLCATIAGVGQQLQEVARASSLQAADKASTRIPTAKVKAAKPSSQTTRVAAGKARMKRPSAPMEPTAHTSLFASPDTSVAAAAPGKRAKRAAPSDESPSRAKRACCRH